MLLVRLCRTRRCPVLNSYIDFNIGHLLIKNNKISITFLLHFSALQTLPPHKRQKPSHPGSIDLPP